MYSIGSTCLYNVYRSIPEYLKEKTMKKLFQKVSPLKEQRQNEIINLVNHMSDDELAFLTFYILSLVDKNAIFSMLAYTETEETIESLN